MKSLEEVVIENQNLIYSLINYFKNYNQDRREDLFQAGVIGMIQAYKNYDDGMGTKFTTYAYPYILGEMKKHIREDSGVKLSRGVSELNGKIEKVRSVLSQKYFREPTAQELSEYLSVPEYIIAEALNSKKEIKSIDDDSSEMNLHEIIPDRNQDINTLIALKDELESLSDFERELISNRYFSDRTQSETAKQYGMTQVQISRKEQKVLTKLKNKLVA